MIGTCLYVGLGVKLEDLLALADDGDVSAQLALDMLAHMVEVGWVEPLPEVGEKMEPQDTEDEVDLEIRRQAIELGRQRISP